jgi:hypothetical protein
MIVGYLQKEGVNFYKIKNGEVSELSEESLKFAFFTKKVLVVSKELLFYTRKTYPSLPLNKLKKSVELEIMEFFPISNADYTIKVFETSEKFTIVDIWAWSRDEYKRVPKGFNFQYVIPEDLLFREDESVVKVFRSKGLYHLIAFFKGRFLGSLSLASLSHKEMEFFLKGLLPYSDDIKKVIIYGDILMDLTSDRMIMRLPVPSYPLSLDGIPKINLRDFKVKMVWPVGMEFLLEISVYALAGYAVFLGLSVYNYKEAIRELKGKISELDRKIASIEVKPQKEYADLISEVNKRISQTVSPLTLMDELAQRIPIGCTVNRFVLNEKKLEMALTFEDPLEVMELLESSKMIKSVKLGGVPMKKTGTRLYDFTLTVELNGG